MQNFLDKLISSFTRQEYREFKYFLLRRPNVGEDRKDLQMLEAIRNKTPFEKENTNASYQVRKGLKRQLEEFIVMQNVRSDDAAEIRMRMDIAKFLFQKNLYDKAWDYLADAETLAETCGEYKLLDQILNIQISYSYNIAIPAAQNTSVPELLNKRTKSKILESKQTDANAAYCELIYEIKKGLAQNLSINIEALKSDIFRKYNLDENYDDHNLQAYCNYVNIVLMTLREEKKYEVLKQYSISCYSFLFHKNLIGGTTNDFLHSLLDNICISTMRTKDYISYEKFISLYSAHTAKMQAGSHEKTYYDFIKYIDLSDLYLVTDRLPLAKESLVAAKKEYASVTQSTRIYYILRFNLMATYFSCQEYSECIRIYQEIMMYDEKKFLNEIYFRIEYLLLADICAVIFYYEDGDSYFALHLLGQLKRKYAALLKKDTVARENTFIKILSRLLKNASYIKSAAFASDAETFIALKAFVPADWEFISLNAWLASKCNRQSYYECFLTEVSSTSI